MLQSRGFQHTGELKTILQRLKAEHRIADFTALDVGGNPDTLPIKNEDHQGIIVLLTNEIERVRTHVENMLKGIIRGKQDIKLIEIIVDNLPYHNNFISFPQDLMPIRTRDDMNLICLGGRVTGVALAKEIVQVFLLSAFNGGEKYQRRLNKIAAIEK